MYVHCLVRWVDSHPGMYPPPWISPCFYCIIFFAAAAAAAFLVAGTTITQHWWIWLGAKMLRPLQINFLPPTCIGYCSKYSIIPYSSILFRLFLHSDWTISLHVSAVLSNQHRFHVCVILCSFLQVLIAFVQLYQVNNGCKSCNEIMEMDCLPACKNGWGQDGKEEIYLEWPKDWLWRKSRMQIITKQLDMSFTLWSNWSILNSHWFATLYDASLAPRPQPCVVVWGRD